MKPSIYYVVVIIYDDSCDRRSLSPSSLAWPEECDAPSECANVSIKAAEVASYRLERTLMGAADLMELTKNEVDGGSRVTGLPPVLARRRTHEFLKCINGIQFGK